MRLNLGEAFFHPVTHRLIESNSFYKGAAHLEHEIIEEVEEELKVSSKTGKGKSTASKDSEENKDDEENK
jgi:hypothetical protein